MGILFMTLAFAAVSMLAIESTPPAWRKVIGGLILLSALLAGIAPDH